MSPTVNKRLIDDLKKRWPNTLPTRKDVTLSDIHRAQGAQEVLTYLEDLLKTQSIEQEILSNVL